LISALNAELTSLYPEEGANHFRLDAEEVEEGSGAFLVVFDRGFKRIPPFGEYENSPLSIRLEKPGIALSGTAESYEGRNNERTMDAQRLSHRNAEHCRR
jgi:hypothetical protein